MHPFTKRHLHPLSLSFLDPETEARYGDYAFTRLRPQARVAISIGMLVYLLYGFLDAYFVTPDHLEWLRNSRLPMMWIPGAVLLLSFTRLFVRWHPLLLGAVGLAAGLVIIAKLKYLPPEMSVYYFPGLLLVVFFIYNLLGLRFVHALLANWLLLVAYGLPVLAERPYPEAVLLSQGFFLVATNLIGGAAAYLGERKHRRLFTSQLELEHLSSHDALTGLLNRRALGGYQEICWQRWRRNGESYAVVYADIDNFKAINDRHGHETGDRVLAMVAHALQFQIRSIDTLVRMGGEEFVILLAGLTPGAELIDIIERFRLAVQDLQPWPEDPQRRISISFGIAVPDTADTTAESVMIRADRALYRAKANGRNRAEFAEAPVIEGAV